ncbi:hypothetical protein BX285_1470 [Streptomyces sp. 1114.5]|uniref:hypothetical protein n=1 Tax=unclassified Streptomyces TaxID=2593676 RepID=UPI000BD98A7F|nr:MULTISPECIES: hypothetical protein [unclassified Streptomyces]RKT17106.1 hypothetical protein BX285_1470 [Streptomyces sp. 1114.5]SOB83315.1 hypothetical protein SAMN06272789_3519 [Streptomyces sp. 1331.2]
MSTNRSRRIDRDTAEQLLGGAVGGTSAGQDASLTGPDGPGQLARVLAAAAAPATAGELAGEEAALAAFREASLTPDPVVDVNPVRRRPMATTALARAFSTKAAAAVLGATALCGVAVAAGTGNLSVGGSTEPEHTLSAGGALGSSSGPGATAGFRAGGAAPDGSVKPSGAGAQPVGPSASPTQGTPSADGHGGQPLAPALAALCHGFTDREGKGEHPGQLAAESQFGPLVDAAGGADKVERYCVDGLAAQGGDSRPGAGAPSHDPGRADGSTQGSGSGNSSGSGSGNGKGTGNDTKGGGDGNANGGAKPGKPGVTVPSVPAVPTPPAVRPSKPDHPDGSAAER